MSSQTRYSKSLLTALALGTAVALLLIGWSTTRAATWQQNIFDAHNAYRAKHCVPELSWSKKIAASAQQWANYCSFSHPGGHGYGENLGWGHSAAKKVVASWYNEISKYSYSRPGFSMATGHFTQVVWRNSRTFGCGMAICNGQKFWVCRYSPPGNVTGQFRANVPQRCG